MIRHSIATARHRAWAAALVISAVGQTAPGDGCFINRIEQADDLVASPKQEAVLLTDGRAVTVVLRTHFHRGPEELAWIVPVPAKPRDVTEADEELFRMLDAETVPRFLQPGRKGGGLHCGCALSPNMGQDLRSDAPVTVEATGTAGVFEYVVLSARKPKALHVWLDAHEYAVPVGAAGVFERYVAAGWYWLAMRVRPDDADDPTLAPHPVAYTYSDGELVYPLAISQLSAGAENEILLYVFAPERHACANWANYTVERERLVADADSPSGTNYATLVRKVTAAHDDHLFVTEYAADAGGAYQAIGEHVASRPPPGATYLTRLRAVISPRAMDRDVTLVPVAGWGDVSNWFTIPQGESAAAAAALGGWARLAGGACLALAGVGLLARRRCYLGALCLAAAAAAATVVPV
ncbi:MAG: DUF2330 domain-containing protein [Planctomycetota bacterium]